MDRNHSSTGFRRCSAPFYFYKNFGHEWDGRGGRMCDIFLKKKTRRMRDFNPANKVAKNVISWRNSSGNIKCGSRYALFRSVLPSRSPSRGFADRCATRHVLPPLPDSPRVTSLYGPTLVLPHGERDVFSHDMLSRG